MTRRRSRQRHSAGYQETEGRIFYPFHPRHGLIVSITGRNRHQGAEVFIIRCYQQREHHLKPAV